jgi:RNA polymerase sigma factor (sigma-70 family)
MSHRPTVFLVDPDRAIRELVRNLTHLMELECLAYSTGQEFVDGFDPARSGCLVMEIRVPGINGLQVQKWLHDSGSLLPVVFITAAPSVSIAVHAMRAGAVHVLEKPVRDNDLLNVIQEAIGLDRQRRLAQYAQQQVNNRIAALNEREQVVLELIADGVPKHAIAQQLGVSVRTVENHRTQLMRKLQTNSLAGLMQLALSRRNGQVSHDGARNYRLVASSS